MRNLKVASPQLKINFLINLINSKIYSTESESHLELILVTTEFEGMKKSQVTLTRLIKWFNATEYEIF